MSMCMTNVTEARPTLRRMPRQPRARKASGGRRVYGHLFKYTNYCSISHTEILGVEFPGELPVFGGTSPL